MLQENEESVVLLIRCALQLFEDIRINFPIDSTVLQLKNKLADICPSKPEVGRQRLIYAGYCLQDHHTLRSIFECHSADSDFYVIHLVCPPAVLKDLDNLRLRKKPSSSDSSHSSSQQQQQRQQQQQHEMPSTQSLTSSPPYSYYPWQPWPNTNYFIPFDCSDPQFLATYNAYMASYTNYIQQIFSNNGDSIPNINQHPLGFQFLNQAASVQQQLPEQNVQEEAGRVDNNRQAVGEVVQDAMGGVIGGIEDPQRDFLDTVYKAIRLCFLIVLVYAYSTPERFICVILFILGLWFVQARRNQRLDREQAERAAQRNPVEAPNILQSQATENSSENRNNDNGIQDESYEAAYREPTAWTVFWSTCYTFITSFFTSLIPDNPVPVNVN
ncbi:unnamed protein product [Dracunculus medinensis]|uniref:Ubiquitin-like domain-containing protein n=1 Tax=Dracunculus medinensis TaxID=318479 RepID=A0A0N4UF86_DRAME|nr:unnamed protein product [Dracunculus medinensis]